MNRKAFLLIAASMAAIIDAASAQAQTQRQIPP